MKNFFLDRKHTGLIVVDVQEKLFSKVERGAEVLEVMLQLIKSFQILQLPIVVTEQYPQGLGPTLPILKQSFCKEQKYLAKTSFSCVADPKIKDHLFSLPIQTWVVIGIEAHVCILQTVKDLLADGKDVVVINDAITSRSIFDFSTAIGEMRDMGVRVSSAETVLFELLRDSKVPEFKAVSQLIKEGFNGGCCCKHPCG